MELFYILIVVRLHNYMNLPKLIYCIPKRVNFTECKSYFTFKTL